MGGGGGMEVEVGARVVSLSFGELGVPALSLWLAVAGVRVNLVRLNIRCRAGRSIAPNRTYARGYSPATPPVPDAGTV